MNLSNRTVQAAITAAATQLSTDATELTNFQNSLTSTELAQPLQTLASNKRHARNRIFKLICDQNRVRPSDSI